MDLLISKYSRQYRRISISSDAKSQHASDMLFYGIRDILMDEIPKTLKLSRSEPLSKVHILDEYNYMTDGYDVVPFRVVVNNWLPNIQMDDGFLFRGMHWVSLSGYSVPTKIMYQSDLIIQLVDNKFSVIKDRYGIEKDKYTNMDVRPFLRSSKIKSIIKNING